MQGRGGPRHQSDPGSPDSRRRVLGLAAAAQDAPAVLAGLAQDLSKLNLSSERCVALLVEGRGSEWAQGLEVELAERELGVCARVRTLQQRMNALAQYIRDCKLEWEVRRNLERLPADRRRVLSAELRRGTAGGDGEEKEKGQEAPATPVACTAGPLQKKEAGMRLPPSGTMQKILKEAAVEGERAPAGTGQVEVMGLQQPPLLKRKELEEPGPPPPSQQRPFLEEPATRKGQRALRESNEHGDMFEAGGVSEAAGELPQPVPVSAMEAQPPLSSSQGAAPLSQQQPAEEELAPFARRKGQPAALPESDTHGEPCEDGGASEAVAVLPQAVPVSAAEASPPPPSHQGAAPLSQQQPAEERLAPFARRKGQPAALPESDTHGELFGDVGVLEAVAVLPLPVPVSAAQATPPPSLLPRGRSTLPAAACKGGPRGGRRLRAPHLPGQCPPWRF